MFDSEDLRAIAATIDSLSESPLIIATAVIAYGDGDQITLKRFDEGAGLALAEIGSGK